MPAISYNYTAVNCPIPQAPSSLINPGSITPDSEMTVHEYINLGEVLEGLNKHNRNTIRQEASSRFGGGGYATAWGLDLEEVGGLTGNISDGIALLDGPVIHPADESITIPNSTARYCVYFDQTGGYQGISGLGAPTGVATYLGSYTTSAGAITERDYSGRMMKLPGGMLYRRTADLGMPADGGSLPAGIQFLNRGGDGSLYLWDGTKYWPLSPQPNPAGFDHIDTLGGQRTFLGAMGNLTWATANRAILCPVRPRIDTLVTKLVWRSGTTMAGNYDVGIYTQSGTRLWSKGSTAAPATATNTIEVVSPSVQLTGGELYYLAMAWDGTTPVVVGLAPTTSQQQVNIDNQNDILSVLSAFPLPNPIAPGATASSLIPWMNLRK
jgi:hypothetical protein